ncbi:MAG: hypothetical protein KJ011_05265 [Burkholderiaceae bacterium]|nr:hypothetical protein [Burkholderiaceae bacterium]
MKRKHEVGVELSDALDLAVVVDGERLSARLTPATARRLAGALAVLAEARSPGRTNRCAARSAPAGVAGHLV